MAKKVVPGSITEPYKIGQGDFSPNLVGQQFSQGTTMFTLGNFSITTNTEGSALSTVYNTGSFSEAYTLETLNITEEESAMFSNETIKTFLNLDPNNLNRFVYFGSFYEYITATIKSILLKWKGSLYVDIFIPTDPTAQVKNTVLDYTYDSVENKSYFKVPTSVIINKFNLIYNTSDSFNGLNQNNIFNSSDDFGDIYDLNTHYQKYQISNIFGDYLIDEFTGSTTSDPYIHLKVDGNPWASLETIGFGSFTYHIRPTEEVLNKYFFSQLNEFENQIMNRLTTPQYSYSLNIIKKTEAGNTFNTQKIFTWPTTDGYNIDNGGASFDYYLTNWLDASKQLDEYKTDLIARRFITSSIVEFDTEGDGTDIYGRKINKLLRIYGREFDEIKKHIDGLEFAKIITYNKKDNAPDEIVKMLASELGLDVLLSFFDNNLFTNSLPGDSGTIGDGNLQNIPFSGYSRYLSPKEMDTELWRRLVINAWWLFKSKGHRKVLEFFLNLFGIKDCVVSLNEHVYIAKNAPLDVDETFRLINEYNGLTGSTPDSTQTYPMDSRGFPELEPDTPDYYYQSYGFWYNGGNLSEIGNNPHIGPYDYGNNYFDRLRCFIDGFNGLTTGTTTFTTLNNLFTDYEEGTIESGVPSFGPNYADLMEFDDRKSDDLNIISAGGDNTITYNNSGQSLRIKFSVTDNSCPSFGDIPCPSSFIEYENGLIFIGVPEGNTVTNDSSYDYILESDIPSLYISDPQRLVNSATMTQQCCIEAGGIYEPISNTTNIGDTFTALDLFNSVNSSQSLACYWCPETKVVNQTIYQTTTSTGENNCIFEQSNQSDLFLYGTNHILLKNTLPFNTNMSSRLDQGSEYKITFTLDNTTYGPFIYDYEGVVSSGTIFDGGFYIEDTTIGNTIKIAYNDKDQVQSQDLKSLFDYIKQSYNIYQTTSEGDSYLKVSISVKIEYNGSCQPEVETTTTELNYEIIKSTGDKDITNSSCCTLRGGQLQTINGNTMCVKNIN